MSSFNLFTPSTPLSTNNNDSFGPCSSSFNSITPNSCPKPSSKPSRKFRTRKRTKSILNPSAASYIPHQQQKEQKEQNQLNAGAKPYIPLPAKISKKMSKPLPKAKKVSFPSFAWYQKLQSHQIYNATKHINDTRSQYSSLSTISSISDTPIPASVTASYLDDSDSENEIMHIDLDNIKPYIPDFEDNKVDIDLVYNISNTSTNTNFDIEIPTISDVNVNVISEDRANGCDTFSDSESSVSSDDDIHPVLAALNAEKSNKELINAPVWSPDDIDADTTDSDDLEMEDAYFNDYNDCIYEPSEEDNDEEEEEKIAIDVKYSKVAVEEEDYQYIIHPTKKPIKYGYLDANKSISKVAMDDNMIYPPHIQYMQQYHYGGSYIIQQPGESYDQYLEQLVVDSSNVAATSPTAYDGYTQTALTAHSAMNTTTELINDKHANSDNGSVSRFSIQSSESSSLSDSSSIAPPAEAPKASTPSIAHESSPATPSPAAVAAPAEAQESLPMTNTNIMGYVTKQSNKHLYKRHESKIAVAQEGSNYNHTANIASNMVSKVAADPYRYNNYGYQTNYYQNYNYGELYSSNSNRNINVNSRVAQAPISQIQYVYCRT